MKELIILGNGPSRTKCDYHCETWGVNGGYAFAKRLDKLFMMDSLEGEVLQQEYDVQKLVAFDGTLVLTDYYHVFDGLNLKYEIFPMKECLKKFDTRFYCNTIAYMLAYALLYTKSEQGPDELMPKVVEGYNKIWMYGIDMMSNTTYVQEKGGVEYWMGIALGMGVEVIIPKESAVGKTWDGKMYGFYGIQEEGVLDKQLYIPWEMVKSSGKPPKKEEIEFIWKKIGEDWIRVPLDGHSEEGSFVCPVCGKKSQYEGKCDVCGVMLVPLEELQIK